MRTQEYLVPPGVVITRNVSEMPHYYREEGSFRTPLRRSETGVELVVLEQTTKNGEDAVLSIPDALGIHGDTQIGLSRASRIMQPGQTSVAVYRTQARDVCSLCEDTSALENRMVTEVDNRRPFGPLLHKVVFSKRHVESLSDIGCEEILDSTDQFFQIAKHGVASLGERLDGFAIGMNFGEYARCGASQAHFHYQVTGLGKANYNPGDRLGELCRSYSRVHGGADYLSDYEGALRQSDLTVANEQNDLAFAFAPISPRFRGEVQIMLRRRQRGKQPGNILETTPEERAALSRLQYDIILRFARAGCEAMNEVWYMTRFSAGNSWGQRLIISLCPRTAIIAFYELFGNSVIDVLPWTLAEILRQREPIGFSLRQ